MINKKLLFATTAAMALAFNGAFAFGSGNWDWNSLDIDITSDTNPSSLTMIKNSQVQIGDVFADSTVTSVHGGLSASIASTATAVGNNMTIDMSAANNHNQLVLAETEQLSLANVSAYSNVEDLTFRKNKGVSMDVPQITSVATAVGNNLAITVNGNGGN